jgi:hypothetical protein
MHNPSAAEHRPPATPYDSKMRGGLAGRGGDSGRGGRLSTGAREEANEQSRADLSSRMDALGELVDAGNSEMARMQARASQTRRSNAIRTAASMQHVEDIVQQAEKRGREPAIDALMAKSLQLIEKEHKEDPLKLRSSLLNMCLESEQEKGRVASLLAKDQVIANG